MIVATVEPSELQGPPGSTLLWSTHVQKSSSRGVR